LSSSGLLESLIERQNSSSTSETLRRISFRQADKEAHDPFSPDQTINWLARRPI
jgi:hypothetical protein